GGALAISVADTIMMLQYSTYSVISPEGCASILWKSAEKAQDAAEAMGITANRLHEAGLIDQVIEEPLGGAHRDYDQTAASLKDALLQQLSALRQLDTADMVSRRQEKIRAYGFFQA
ncbi:MAG: acetyl-CoA carboxylase carboxyl transferase subunit alpha, partial [Gammaproteobacteria bacterium]